MSKKHISSIKWRPDPTDSSNYDIKGWPLEKIGWEFLRRSEKYQITCCRIHATDDRSKQAKLEGPMWGLDRIFAFVHSWDVIKNRFSIRFLSRTTREDEAIYGFLYKSDKGERRVIRPAIDLWVALGDSAALRIQLDKIAKRADKMLSRFARERGIEFRRSPRIQKDKMGMYLRLLDLVAQEPKFTPKRIGQILYRKSLSSRALSRKLSKDRKEARYLADFGYVKFLVRAYNRRKEFAT